MTSDRTRLVNKSQGMRRERPQLRRRARRPRHSCELGQREPPGHGPQLVAGLGQDVLHLVAVGLPVHDSCSYELLQPLRLLQGQLRPTIAAYRNIAADPDRVAALDKELAGLADRFNRVSGTLVLDWQYLLLTSRKRQLTGKPRSGPPPGRTRETENGLPRMENVSRSVRGGWGNPRPGKSGHGHLPATLTIARCALAGWNRTG